MTRDELLKFFDSATADMRKIMEAKNTDYTGAIEGDPFANFTRVETLGVATTEQGFLTRMLDKFMRLSAFVKNGTLAVKAESSQDTLLDLANYCILFAAYQESKK